ncbi:hypothetical protein TSUD_250550 [Trifolium subterraneum]|nr:hypothetical protein TSUD_250550 [Trifolium subterraneum]
MVRDFCDQIGGVGGGPSCGVGNFFNGRKIGNSVARDLESVALFLVEDFWSWRPDPEGKFPARNKAPFANGTFTPKVIVEEIKLLGWKWCLARTRLSPCMFYEWTWDPRECLLQ